MFVSASFLCDYRAERPPVAVRPLISACRGLSGIGWNEDAVVGRDRVVGDEIDDDRRDATRCEAVCALALGAIGLLDPITQRHIRDPEILRDLVLSRARDLNELDRLPTGNSGGYGGLVRGTSHLLAIVFRRKPSGVLETGGTPAGLAPGHRGKAFAERPEFRGIG